MPSTGVFFCSTNLRCVNLDDFEEKKMGGDKPKKSLKATNHQNIFWANCSTFLFRKKKNCLGFRAFWGVEFPDPFHEKVG